jgi:hypothetical protein
MSHRPQYCSNNDSGNCIDGSKTLREGIPFLGGHRFFALEPLMRQAGVDLAFWAHEHSYERLFPTFASKVYKGSEEEPYTNPGATVHIITGSAGCKENHDG